MTRVAVVQMSAPADGGSVNRSLSAERTAEAFEQGADVVVLPELIMPGYTWNREVVEELSEPVDGETVNAWADVAAAAGGFVAGGFAERDGGTFYNAAVLVGEDGVLLHYRKLHLFAGEKAVFNPGDLGLPLAETRYGRIGICVCYDLRFVEVLRALALRGAELVYVPTAWVPGFDAERWDADGFCPQARSAVVQANLDQVSVACASQVGDNGEHEFLGSSIVVSPRGHCLVGPLSGDRDETSVADLDPDAARAARDRGGGVRPGADRRSDVYAVMLDGQRL